MERETSAAVAPCATMYDRAFPRKFRALTGLTRKQGCAAGNDLCVSGAAPVECSPVLPSPDCHYQVTAKNRLERAFHHLPFWAHHSVRAATNATGISLPEWLWLDEDNAVPPLRLLVRYLGLFVGLNVSTPT